jgi:hypothetical protein
VSFFYTTKILKFSPIAKRKQAKFGKNFSIALYHIGIVQIVKEKNFQKTRNFTKKHSKIPQKHPKIE